MHKLQQQNPAWGLGMGYWTGTVHINKCQPLHNFVASSFSCITVVSECSVLWSLFSTSSCSHPTLWITWCHVNQLWVQTSPLMRNCSPSSPNFPLDQGIYLHLLYQYAPHIMWDCVTSCDPVLDHVTSCDPVLDHVTSCDLVLDHVASCDPVSGSCDIMWPWLNCGQRWYTH